MTERENIPRQRIEGEIALGRVLATADPESVWGWETVSGRHRFKRRVELIVQGARLRPGLRALEIGCGSGLFTAEFARSGAQIVAVDISPDLLALARRRGLPADQVTFLEAPFESGAFEGPFDAVIGSSVLHHLDLRASLSRIYDLLKPGGFMSFAEPNYLNPQIFLERKLRFLRPIFWYVSPNETAFVRWRLRRNLTSAGFFIDEITPFDWLHPSTPGGLIVHIQRAGHLLEKTPLVREFAGSLFILCHRPL